MDSWWTPWRVVLVTVCGSVVLLSASAAVSEIIDAAATAKIRKDDAEFRRSYEERDRWEEDSQ